jgi:DNA-binding CsgD family transcriptional regulator
MRTRRSSRLGDIGALVRASKSIRAPKAGEGVQKRRRLVANFCLMLGEQMLDKKRLVPDGKRVMLGGDPLSPRQRQTLELLLIGHAEKQIAAQLSISRHTVHVYVKSLYKRFDVNSRGELLARWVHQ